MTTPGVAYYKELKKKIEQICLQLVEYYKEFSLVWKLRVNLESMD